MPPRNRIPTPVRQKIGRAKEPEIGLPARVDESGEAQHDMTLLTFFGILLTIPYGTWQAQEGRMSVPYRLFYRLGFHPWEDLAEHPPFAEALTALFEREEREREPPYGRALDLGCGSAVWGIKLAKRGWQVTGVELVEKALERARERVREAGADMRLVQGDATHLRDADIGRSRMSRLQTPNRTRSQGCSDSTSASTGSAASDRDHELPGQPSSATRGFDNRPTKSIGIVACFPLFREVKWL